MNRILLIGIATVAVIAGGGVLIFRPAGVPVRTAEVAIEDIQQYVDERGRTRLSQTFDITMPLAGRLQEIGLQVGDTVVTDQVVAQMVAEDLDNRVAEAQAAVDRLKASIVENNDNSVEERARQQSESLVESMRHTVAAAEGRQIAGAKRSDFSKRVFERTRDLQKRNAETIEELERAELDFVESQVNYQQDILTWKAAQAMLIASELLPKIIDEYMNRKRLQSEVLQKQLEESTAHLKQFQIDRQRGAMRSSVDGVVLQRNYDDEQYVPAGAVLLTIGRWQDMEVVVDVLSHDATRITVDGDATIYGIDGDGPQGFSVSGKVKRVEPQAFTKVSSLGVEQQRVNVVVQLESTAIEALRRHAVGADYRVRVRLVTGRSSQATTVPRSALFRGADGGWEVFMVRDGRAVRQVVEVGLTNDSSAEILTGLESGQRVVLSPENDVTDGVRVTID